MTSEPDSKGRSVCLLVYNAIPDDPRVKRQGDALSAAGWQVAGVGLPGGRGASPTWLDEACRQSEAISSKAARNSEGQSVEESGQAPGKLDRIRKAVRLGLLHLLVLIVPKTSDWAYWRIFPFSQDLFRRAVHVEADVWLANDWNTLPIALRLAQKKGGCVIYDTHEFAVDEYDQKLLWRVLRKPLVSAIEGAALRSKKIWVSTVSSGIADALQCLYQLRQKPVVIRNTPPYVSVVPRKTGKEFRVLYHGVVSPGRGLEECIEAASLWRKGVTLSIRGPASPAYYEVLRKKVRDLHVEEKVEFLPAVQMADLVVAASEFDIGLFSLPGHSRHNQYALPNKLFEYIAAGLCVCVSSLPEMAEIVKRYDVGRLVESNEAVQIASVIDSLSVRDVDYYKSRSMQAAKELCWEKESRLFLSLIEKAVTQKRDYIE